MGKGSDLLVSTVVFSTFCVVVDSPAQQTRSDGAVRLTEPVAGASDQNPAYSPEGDRLLFTRFQGGYNAGPSSLYLLDVAGNIVLLTGAADSDSVNLPGSSWNGTTERIAFASDREDRDEIWTVAPDGSALFRVTRHTSLDHFIEPTFSPDGAWIVFEVDPPLPEDEQQGSIMMVRADGTEPTRVTDGPSGGTDDRQPNWSPTADRILFQRRPSQTDDWNIFTVGSDGSGVQQVTTSSANTDASWSPDGRWIVYSTDEGLATASLFVISAEGGVPVRVTSDESSYDGAPSWSPDGLWIAFESHPGADDAPSQIWHIASPVPGMLDPTRDVIGSR